MLVISTNRKALRDYSILETIECGIELKGSEVKSLRRGNLSLSESFARIEDGQVFLYNADISPYEKSSIFNVERKRKRKLLLHKSQIDRLKGKITQRGLTLIPLKAYFNERGIAKIELALSRGKRLYERREDIRKKEAELEIRKILKGGERSRLR